MKEVTYIDIEKLSTDQLRQEVRRLLALSSKVNSQASLMARALKRRLKEDRRREQQKAISDQHKAPACTPSQ